MSSSSQPSGSDTTSGDKALCRKPAFVTTHWSVVLAAGRSDTTRACAALEKLCRTYWYPLYAYVRRRGHSPEDAKDLTQEFFARLLERKAVATASPEKGRFRSFLLAAMNHFLADAWDKTRARKRGYGQVIPLDGASAETLYLQQPVEALTPEKAYDRRWALALLEEVYRRLQQEYQQGAKASCSKNCGSA